MAEMPKIGYVVQVGGRRRLVQFGRLLHEWTDAYARVLKPKLLLGRYRSDTSGWWTTLNPLDYGQVVGGEVAAAKLTNILRPGTLTLYGRKVEPRLVLEKRLKPDLEGNVEFLRRFWEFDVGARELAPAVLVYADLLAIGDARCLEAAKHMQGEILAGLG